MPSEVARRLGWLLLVFVFLLPVGSASGNAGPIRRDPLPIGEPQVDLGAIRVLHEQLTVDLRPVADQHLASIVAVYRFENAGPPVTIPAVFATPFARYIEVAVDGKPIEARTFDPMGEMPPLPPHWSAALSDKLKYEEAAWFDFALPSGEHELTVKLKAGSGYDKSDRPMTSHIRYLLSPARDWSAFGTLDVRAHVPDGYIVTSTPALTPDESGDLVGTFDGIPADVLAFEITQDAGLLAWVWLGMLAAVGVVVLVVIGRRSVRAIENAGAGWTTLLVLGTPVVTGVWGTAWFVVYVIVDDALMGPHAEYGALTPFLLAFPISIIAGIGASVTGIQRRRLATPE